MPVGTVIWIVKVVSVLTFEGTGDELMLMPACTAGVTNTVVTAVPETPFASITVALTV